MNTVGRPWQRVRQTVRRSLRAKLILVFLLLAVAMAATFVIGIRKTSSSGWGGAGRSLLADYADHLAAEIGSPPSVEKAQAMALRLPIWIRIEGPVVHWNSQMDRSQREGVRSIWRNMRQYRDPSWLLRRRTADGHRIEFGLDFAAGEKRSHLFAWFTLAALVLTMLAYLYVRRLLSPLDDIRAGAHRFGTGDFGYPIPVRNSTRPDELGQLAVTINEMGNDIQQMLDAKRALLLAISHELRSPLTRARLNTELLPETTDVAFQRDALLRDLHEMSRLITDLLESEHLASRHVALHREDIDLLALTEDVVGELKTRFPAADRIVLHCNAAPPKVALDEKRMRLLVRNLLDNALRHTSEVLSSPEIHLEFDTDNLRLEVRDYGPGVPENALPHLAQPFYRPEAARSRSAGGVGLGLYLCHLVVHAHGGHLSFENASPGLRVSVQLPVNVGS